MAVLEDLRNNVPAVPDETFNQLVGAQNTYSSRLQLFGPNSAAVTEQKIKAGRFAIVNGQDLTDVGDEVILMPVAIRAKAMDLSGPRPVIAYDLAGSLFKDIQLRSKTKDSNCMCGVEFLVYLPNQDTFTTFYLANATLLREAGNMKANIGLAVKVKSKLIKKDKFAWYGIQIASFPTEIAVPEKTRFESEIAMFGNARDTVLEEEAPATT